MFAPIRENLPHSAVRFLQDDDHPRSLNELIRKRQKLPEGKPRHLAMRSGIRPRIREAALQNVSSLRPQRSLLRFEIRSDADAVLVKPVQVIAWHAKSIQARPEQTAHFLKRRGLHLPQSRKVRLALDTRRRSRQIRFPIASPRRPWRGRVHPLRLRARGK